MQHLTTVGQLLKHYFNVAFLMGKPQDLPAGPSQLRVGIALALLTYVVALVIPLGVGRALLQASIDLGATGTTLWFALSLTGRSNRFEQAFGGLCGASAFINLAAAPLYLTRPGAASESGGSLGVLPDFVLLVWGLSLLAHVIRHTFEVKMVVSVLLSFVYFLVLISLMSLMLPTPASMTDNAVSGLMIEELLITSNPLPDTASTTFGVVAFSSRML